MENQLVKIERYSPEEVALIKSQIAPKANDTELKLFLYQCERTGLNPLARQIYAIHRWSSGSEKMTIQTSIDGFRVIAERSGVYGGQSEPEFDYKGEALNCCKVRVYKFNNGVRYEASVGVAFWSEYVQLGKDQKPMGLWAKMPHTMLAKVAEALALRKAFPQDLSGLYTGDEMSQADKTEEADFSEVPTNEERKMLIKLTYTSNLDEEVKEQTIEFINTKCHNYKVYEALQHKLEAAQPAIDEIVNPNQTDINKHLKMAVQ